jgi:hypothetical protein
MSPVRNTPAGRRLVLHRETLRTIGTPVSVVRPGFIVSSCADVNNCLCPDSPTQVVAPGA